MILTILFGLLTLAQSQCPSGCICDEHDKSAQCVQTDEDAKFVHIPDGLPWYVQEIILTDNLIKIIPADAIPKRNNIQNLNFRRNQINTIHEDAFSSQNKLLYLTLSNNKLTRIPGKSISKLKLLKELFLDNNGISTIRQKTFENNEQLEWLHLGNNNISTVSGDAFVGLQRIKFLNLEGNSIKAIGGNTLAHLSGCIILDLSRNQIKRVHEKGFESLVYLNQLKLESNELGDDSFPNDVFDRMGRLENLNLANNSLGAAPGHKVWHGLRKLESLHLTGNHIPIITSENFKNLKSLKRLFLDDNRIVAIEENGFGELEVLEELDLSQNRLAKIMKSRLHKLTKLRSLDLRENQIKIIEASSMDDLESLKSLDLGKNNLEEIDSELLHKSPKLQHLVIDHNKLTVPLVKWQKYGNNVHLSLAGNPWHCDCPMLIFINSILNEDYGAKIDGSLQEMKCSSPENLIGHPVTDIEEDHLHCWTPIDFIYDAGIVIWLIALCVVVKKRRIIQSICWCCFGSSEKPPHALP